MSFISKLTMPLVLGAFFLTGCQPKAPDGVQNSATSQVIISPTVIASSATLGSKVTMALSSEPRLKGSNIMVSVSNLDRTVSLSGMVKQKAQEQLALQIAKKQAKEVKVVSQLTILPTKTFKKSADGKKTTEECCR